MGTKGNSNLSAFYMTEILTFVNVIRTFSNLVYFTEKTLCRSGQVRSECLTSTFKASCCSGSSVRDRKKGGGSKGRPPALEGTREYEQSDRNR